MAAEITVGIDIGTSSVKAVAADPDGRVVASSRVPHDIQIPAADRFQHNAVAAWRDGPVAALDALGLDAAPRGVSVAAMVPSLTAVDAAGVPRTPGLLYGDGRGRSSNPGGNPVESGELLAFLRWSKGECPDAAGFWPATAVANHALAGEAVLDTSTAATAFPLFDWTGWDAEVAASLGIDVAQLPRLVATGWECGRIGGAGGPVLASGCIDALADQIVAGADREGDVLVLLGTTLIVNLITPSHDPVPGYWVIPHTASGLYQAGGPSNAGGLFVNWATASLREADGGDAAADPHRVPVWAPYPRGERVPLHDPDRRAVLADLDLTHGVAALRRAAFEASGFVARRTIETAAALHGVAPRRIVATGGGTRVDAWVQALADCTGLRVECVAVPEGAALGSAFLARCALGLEAGGMPSAARWARVGRTVDPDPAWVGPAADRYERFLALSA
jgi:xylulokinase